MTNRSLYFVRCGSTAAFLIAAFLLAGLLPHNHVAFTKTKADKINKPTLSKPSAMLETQQQDLPIGKTVERELAGGQSHSYQIVLSTGQFLQVVVEQRGIDVLATLFGPNGMQVVESDSPNGSLGSEILAVSLEATGTYRLQVRSLEKDAQDGRYEVRVAELRTATSGDHALVDAAKLYYQAVNLRGQSKSDEAISLARRALNGFEKAANPEPMFLASALNLLAVLYEDKEDGDKAEPFYQHALSVLDKRSSPDSPNFFMPLSGLTSIYLAKGDYTKGESLYQRALAIQEKALGSSHLDVAHSFTKLALLYYYVPGDYAKAEPLLQSALAIFEKALGPQHLNVGGSLYNLANLYHSKGDYAKAEPLYQRALTIKENVLGPTHPDVAKVLNGLALLYNEKGDFAKAELLLQHALTVLEKALPPEHPDVASLLNNLALLYRVKGDYTKAEPLYQRALTIQEKALAPDHPTLAKSLNNLAEVYRVKGDYAKAEPLYQRALAIQEKVIGPEHPDVAKSLNNLGLLYYAKGDYGKAESLQQRALATQEKALGQGHPDVAISLSNLASIYHTRGDYVKTESLQQRALAIREKALGPEHPNVANSLNNLSNLYNIKGDYAKAEPLYQRALTIKDKALGRYHPDFASILNNLAFLYTRKGDLTHAFAYQARASPIIERNLALNLATGSERQKLAYLATLSAQANDIISLHAHSAHNNSIAPNLAISTILYRKGRVLDATSDSIGTLRRRFKPQDQALLDQLKDTNAQLARLVLGGPQNIPLAEHQRQIKTLEDQREKYEAEISSSSAEFRSQSQPVTLDAVRSAIPNDTALVEFTVYLPFNAKFTKPDEAYGQPRYVAYVLRQHGKVQWVELGETKAIDESVGALRRALRDPRQLQVKQLARALDEKLMRPVRALLGQTQRVLLSPDSALNLIPFAALVDEKNRYLVEQYEFTYIPSGRDLLRLQVKLQSKEAPLVIANPDFGGQPAQARRLLTQQPKPIKKQEQAASSTHAFSQFGFIEALPSTAEEGETVQKLLPEAKLLTGRAATKTELKQVASPSILHIATHGFFLEDLKLPPPGKPGLEMLSREPGRLLLQQETAKGTQIENPLLRSGLVLAGANEKKKEDDGFLTAMEVTGMDLWGTKLVVLSACDTGVGEVKNGDGVYGLRRALLLAGAETQVMSLWPVSDKGTQELMVEYYKGLLAKRGRSEAMRQVQLQMLTNPKRRHPYYWASFIVSGEWANLDGKR